MEAEEIMYLEAKQGWRNYVSSLDKLTLNLSYEAMGSLSQTCGLSIEDVVSEVSKINASSSYYYERFVRTCDLIDISKAMDFYILFRDYKWVNSYHNLTHVTILISNLMNLYAFYSVECKSSWLVELATALIFHDIYYHENGDHDNTQHSMAYYLTYSRFIEDSKEAHDRIMFYISALEYPFSKLEHEDEKTIFHGTLLRLLDHSMFISKAALPLYAILVYKLYKNEMGIAPNPEAYRDTYLHYIDTIRKFADNSRDILQNNIIITSILDFDAVEFTNKYFMNPCYFKLYSYLGGL